MHNCFSVRPLALVHMGLGPDHEGQEQCHYAQQNLDHSPHARGLYQNNCPCGEDIAKEMTFETSVVHIASRPTWIGSLGAE